MKKLIIGLIIGMILSTTIQATEQYIGSVAKFQIWMNSQQVTLKDPVLVINNKTYLPLREITTLFHEKVAWNESKRRVEIGDTTASTSREYPSVDNSVNADDALEVTILRSRIENPDNFNGRNIISFEIIIQNKGTREIRFEPKYLTCNVDDKPAFKFGGNGEDRSNMYSLLVSMDKFQGTVFFEILNNVQQYEFSYNGNPRAVFEK